jgi:hypothetical protein
VRVWQRESDTSSPNKIHGEKFLWRKGEVGLRELKRVVGEGGWVYTNTLFPSPPTKRNKKILKGELEAS